MCKRGRNTIGCVGGLRWRFQSKNSRHHELHLLFRGSSSAYDGLFYFGGRILRNLDARISSSEKNHSTSVAEHDGSADILRVENVFD